MAALALITTEIGDITLMDDGKWHHEDPAFAEMLQIAYPPKSGALPFGLDAANRIAKTYNGSFKYVGPTGDPEVIY